jgi:HK97 family phage major capsid protein
MYRDHLTVVPASVVAVLAMGAPVNGSIRADATIEQYRGRLQELVMSQSDIVARAEAEKRELTVEEKKQLDDAAAEFERLEGEIERRERLIAQTQRLITPQPRQAAPEPIPGDDGDGEPSHVTPPSRNPPPALAAARQVAPRVAGNGGFRSFGDFAQAVRMSSRKEHPIVDTRLQAAAATSITQEAVGQDGGFLVPPDFLADITRLVLAEDSLISLCNPLTTGRNSITAPVDETTQWGTGGIKAYWEGEAAAITQSKIALKNVTVRLNKLAALVPVTEEMLEDAPGLDSYLRTKAPEAIDWSISDALVWGTGVGMPLGLMQSPALVTQAAEGGQTADTINATNISKMYARMPARSRRTAVWLINPDAEPQLPQMTIGNQPVYLPPGGLADAPLGRLLGRPVIPHQVCATVGDLGDLIFIDFRQYMAAVKAGGVRLQISIHLWFDQDLQAFKFTIRIAGQPWWSAPMSPRAGTMTQSPFVTLAAR